MNDENDTVENLNRMIEEAKANVDNASIAWGMAAVNAISRVREELRAARDEASSLLARIEADDVVSSALVANIRAVLFKTTNVKMPVAIARPLLELDQSVQHTATALRAAIAFYDSDQLDVAIRDIYKDGRHRPRGWSVSATLEALVRDRKWEFTRHSGVLRHRAGLRSRIEMEMMATPSASGVASPSSATPILVDNPMRFVAPPTTEET